VTRNERGRFRITGIDVERSVVAAARGWIAAAICSKTSAS
jgi:hypothetical protein